MAPEMAHAIPRFVSMMPLLGEMALAAWLAIFGVRGQNSERGAA